MGSGCSTQNSIKINQDNEPQSITNENINNDTQSIITNEEIIDEIQPAIVTHVVIEDYQPDISSNKSNTIIEWKATTPIYRYHWWPMKEAYHTLYNNLYADNGGLDKYDTLIGCKSKEYQKKHHYRETDSNATDANWAGFCDKATILSCLYEYPKHQVKVINKNKEIELTAFDIEALMIIACDNTIKYNHFLFLGERNNSDHPTRNNKSEPLPSDLLDMLRSLSYSKTAFAMDIDSGSAVWNYSYDSFCIKSYTQCNLSHSKPKSGHTLYLNFIINSTAYPNKSQNIWGYINTSNPINTSIDSWDFPIIKDEAWITNDHPDFIWKHFPLDKPWNGKCTINPEVDASIIYKIYQKSLSESEVLTL
jgi:hypothetical protein